MNQQLVTEEQTKVIVAQAIANFDARDELSSLEDVLPGITEDDFDASDFYSLGYEIADAFLHSITAVDGESFIEIDDLRQRLEDMETLPEEWTREGHPMHLRLEEVLEERTALRRFFDEFDDVIRMEDYAFLQPIATLGDHVLEAICEDKGQTVDDLDPILRAALNLDALVAQYKKAGGTISEVDLYGQRWFFAT